jgi:DNA-binding FrmR family transcriptional regulator
MKKLSKPEPKPKLINKSIFKRENKKLSESEVLIRRIKGQLTGVESMIESNQNIIEILTQLASVIGTCNALTHKLIEEYTRNTIMPNLKSSKDQVSLDNFLMAMKRFAKS